jgi:23S rRNA pseudouridine2605 synthase
MEKSPKQKNSTEPGNRIDTGQGKGRKTSSGKSRNAGPGKRTDRGEGKPIRSADEEMRLNRFIAHTGLCSRREADELIRSGQIKVNGRTMTELGTRVSPQDSVSYRGKTLHGEKKVYVLLNKPKDCVTTVKDTHDRQTVMDIVRGCCNERIYPVGRLDRNTTGVLLLTNDGELAETLSHPSFNQKKIYHIHLDRPFEPGDMEKLARGLELEDGVIRPDRVEYVSGNDLRQIGMEIHSGRNRIVRRIFEHMEYKVLRLDRVYYAGLTKKGIPRGHWRHLNAREISLLQRSAVRKQPGKRPTKS